MKRYFLSPSRQNLLFLLRRREFSVKELSWCAPSDSPNRRRRPPAGTSATNNSTSRDEENDWMVPIDRFGIVAAMSNNSRVIGINGTLPWKLKSDRMAFKELTRNKILIMGRRTFQEDEPKRRHISHAAHAIVVSQTLQQQQQQDSSRSIVSDDDDRISLVKTFPEALHLARELVEDERKTMIQQQQTDDDTANEDEDENDNDDTIQCWVAGGERIYNEALLHPSAQSLHLTVVDIEIDIANAPDVARFPAKYRWDHKFQQVSKEEHVDDDGELVSFTKYVYSRIQEGR